MLKCDYQKISIIYSLYLIQMNRVDLEKCLWDYLQKNIMMFQK